MAQGLGEEGGGGGGGGRKVGPVLKCVSVKKSRLEMENHNYISWSQN